MTGNSSLLGFILMYKLVVDIANGNNSYLH